MKAILDGRVLFCQRTETDNPIVERPFSVNPTKVTPEVYNSWRKTYILRFDTDKEAQIALSKVIEIGDFDKAAAWLDKQ